MKLRPTHIVIGLAIIILVALGYATWILRSKDSSQAKVDTQSVNPSTENTSPAVISPAPLTQTIAVQSINGVAKQLNLSVSIPSSWQAEAVESIDAINLYDPAIDNSANLEKSQIFIRYFEANSFLTLSTVDILSKNDTTINGRPAVRYVIKKKAGVAKLPNQPSWRNGEHVVTDIRVSDANPSVFYVIAKHPDLSEAMYQEILSSLIIK